VTKANTGGRAGEFSVDGSNAYTWQNQFLSLDGEQKLRRGESER
jgi:hypothetical protein